MHVDLNAFYATAEQLRCPDYQGKPVIVGGLGRRGVVSTCSYEARSFGVHSAMPIGEAKRLCPNGIYLSCDFPYYEMLSRSFFGYLKKFSSLVEAASIDEGFVDMTKYLQNNKNVPETLKNIQDGLYKELGLKCSIGVGPTKFLAKMASDMKKPMGITIIRKRDIKAKLYSLPIDNFFGVGKKTTPYLKSLGINTIGEFANALESDETGMRKRFGKAYDYYLSSIHGEGDDTVIVEYPDQKSINHSSTFPNDTNDQEEIRLMIERLSSHVAAGLVREKKKCKTVSVNIKDENFKVSSKSMTLEESTNDYEELSRIAWSIFSKAYTGIVIRLVGVSASNLVPLKEKNIQMSFWNYEKYEKEDETQLLVSSLNRKANKKILMMASEVKKNGNK